MRHPSGFLDETLVGTPWRTGSSKEFLPRNVGETLAPQPIILPGLQRHGGDEGSTQMGQEGGALDVRSVKCLQCVPIDAFVPRHHRDLGDQVAQRTIRLTRGDRLPHRRIGCPVSTDRQRAGDGQLTDRRRVGPAEPFSLERCQNRFDTGAGARRDRCGRAVLHHNRIQVGHRIDQQNSIRRRAGHHRQRAPPVHRSLRTHCVPVVERPVGEGDHVVAVTCRGRPHAVEHDFSRPVRVRLL